MPKTRTPLDVDVAAAAEAILAVADLADEVVVCRTIGHRWDENPQPEFRGDLFRAAHAALALRCTRCHAERLDYFNAQMTLFSRQYRYPPRYRAARDQSTRPLLRAELLSRSVLLRRPPADQAPPARRRPKAA